MIRLGPLILCGGVRRGWFRLFGYGLHWRDRLHHEDRFSERNGYVIPDAAFGRSMPGCRWWIKILKRASAV